MSDALMWLGAGMITAGAYLFTPALGLVVGGLFCLAFGFVAGVPKKGGGG